MVVRVEVWVVGTGGRLVVVVLLEALELVVRCDGKLYGQSWHSLFLLDDLWKASKPKKI